MKSTYNQPLAGWRNRHVGQPGILFATGPSLMRYEPVPTPPTLITVGVNFIYRHSQRTGPLDYFFFGSGYESNLEHQTSVQNLKVKEQKFASAWRHGEPTGHGNIAPEEAVRMGAVPFECNEAEFAVDCANESLYGHTIVFPALQFMLYAGLDPIYIVGCDVQSYGNRREENDWFASWQKFSHWQKKIYPHVQIVSVNPKRLRGLFHDLDQPHASLRGRWRSWHHYFIKQQVRLCEVCYERGADLTGYVCPKCYEKYFTATSRQLKQSSNKKVWEKLSPSYTHHYQEPVHRDFLQAVMKAAPTREARILEYGCSWGMNLAYLHEQGYTNLSGIDIATDAISRGRQRYPGLNLTVNDLSAEAEHMEKENSPYDVVFARATVQHIPLSGTQRLLRRLHKLAAPEATLLLAECARPAPYGRLKGHRVYNTFNHNWLALLSQTGWRFMSKTDDWLIAKKQQL